MTEGECVGIKFNLSSKLRRLLPPLTRSPFRILPKASDALAYERSSRRKASDALANGEGNLPGWCVVPLPVAGNK